MSTSTAATNLAFFTTTAGDTSPTERLRITSDGSVGIGTDNPIGVVEIYQNYDNSSDYWLNSGQTLRIRNAHSGGYASLRLLGGGSGSDNNAIVWGGNGHESIIFANRQNERLRITDTGLVRVPDGGKFVAGAGDDLQIYHDGNHSYIDDAGVGNLYIRGGDAVQLQKYTGENFVKCIADGTVQLYYDNSKKLETTNTGVDVTGEVQCDSLDVDGVVDITGEVTLHANLDLQDDDKIMLGTGDDLQIYHNATNSLIVNETGQFFIDQRNNDLDLLLRSDDGSGGVTNYIVCDGSEGEAQLYHYGNQKLATKSTGIEVTGTTDTDNLIISGTVSVGSSTGNDGQYLISTGVGVSWTTLPTARTTTTIIAAEDQTSFPFNYNVGFVDVFYNGVKLADTEFTASNGTAVVLNDVAYAGDVVELISYATAASGGGGGGASNLNGLADVTITGSPIVGETLQHNGTKFVNDFTVTQTTTSTSEVTILGLDVSEYRSVEYQIQVTEGSNYHTTKILAIHNGTAASHNEFGTLSIGTVPATFDVDISGSNMRLLATPASSNSTVFKVKFTGIKV